MVLKFFFISMSLIYSLASLNICAGSRVCADVEVRQLVGVGSLLYCVGSRDQAAVVRFRFGDKCSS